MVWTTTSPAAAMLAVTTLRRSGSSARHTLATASLPLLHRTLTTATFSPASVTCTCTHAHYTLKTNESGHNLQFDFKF